MPPESGSTLLAFELATEACSVALWHDGRLQLRHEVAPRRHIELALPWAEALIAEAGIARSRIDALAVGIGPGAFTGVRLAISLVQGIALGLDRPVLPVSTLAALAEPFVGDGPVLAAIDARMGELYVGAFEADADGLPRVQGLERLLPISAAPSSIFADLIAPAGLAGSLPTGAGTGFAAAEGAWWAPMAERFRHVDPTALPSAAAVARIGLRDFRAGQGMAADRLEPTYLRDKVALTSAEQIAARAEKAAKAGGA